MLNAYDITSALNYHEQPKLTNLSGSPDMLVALVKRQDQVLAGALVPWTAGVVRGITHKKNGYFRI